MKEGRRKWERGGGKKKAAESGEGDGGVRKRLFMRGRKNKAEGVGEGGWRRRLVVVVVVVMLLVVLGKIMVGGGKKSSLMVEKTNDVVTCLIGPWIIGG